MDWPWATAGKSIGYDPSSVLDHPTRSLLIGFRIFGASMVVPVMEELFWRSWLLRYLIDQDVSKVPIGKFTWPSFIICTALFGIEHNLWLAGIMAGTAYSILLYRTKSIAHCMLSHGITNFALGIYVITTGRWDFW
jgi:CAAX prenyl protease-like protein